MINFSTFTQPFKSVLLVLSISKFVLLAIVRSICCIISSSPLFAVSFQVLCTHCIQSMSSTCFVHCCDPLKSHTRKRILGGGSHSLRHNSQQSNHKVSIAAFNTKAQDLLCMPSKIVYVGARRFVDNCRC